MLALVAAGVGLLVACTSDPAPVAGPRAELVDSAAIRAKQESRRAGSDVLRSFGLRPHLTLVKAYGSDTVTFEPQSLHCSENCGTTGPYTGTITASLSRKVVSLRVESNGPFLCSGTLPTIRAYDYLGRVVASGTMSIDHPTDCGADDMSGEASASLASSSQPIAYIEISPPAPWTFQVPTSSGGYVTGRTALDYDVRVTSAAPAEPPCDFGTDTLLASNNVLRQALLKSLRDSRWYEADQTLRKENIGVIYRRSDGSYVDVRLSTDYADQCRLKISNILILNEDSVVAIYHAHPGTPKETQTCRRPDGTLVQQTYHPFADGLHTEDDAALTAQTAAFRNVLERAPVDFWYIDSENVYRIPADPDFTKTVVLKESPVTHAGCRF